MRILSGKCQKKIDSAEYTHKILVSLLLDKLLGGGGGVVADADEVHA